MQKTLLSFADTSSEEKVYSISPPLILDGGEMEFYREILNEGVCIELAQELNAHLFHDYDVPAELTLKDWRHILHMIPSGEPIPPPKNLWSDLEQSLPDSRRKRYKQAHSPYVCSIGDLEDPWEKLTAYRDWSKKSNDYVAVKSAKPETEKRLAIIVAGLDNVKMELSPDMKGGKVLWHVWTSSHWTYPFYGIHVPSQYLQWIGTSEFTHKWEKELLRFIRHKDAYPLHFSDRTESHHGLSWRELETASWTTTECPTCMKELLPEDKPSKKLWYCPDCDKVFEFTDYFYRKHFELQLEDGDIELDFIEQLDAPADDSLILEEVS